MYSRIKYVNRRDETLTRFQKSLSCFENLHQFELQDADDPCCILTRSSAQTSDLPWREVVQAQQKYSRGARLLPLSLVLGFGREADCEASVKEEYFQSNETASFLTTCTGICKLFPFFSSFSLSLSLCCVIYCLCLRQVPGELDCTSVHY